MICNHCGKQLSVADKFCPQCGTPAQSAQTVCTHCGAAIDPSMKFCMQCGAPVGSARAQTAATASIPPLPAGYQAARQTTSTSIPHASTAPTATMPTVPPSAGAPSSIPPASSDSSQSKPNSKKILWIIIAVVIIAIAAVSGYFVWNNQRNNQANNAQSSTAQTDTAQSDNASDSADTNSDSDADKNDENNAEKSCTAAPDAVIDHISRSGDSLLVQFSLSASSCENRSYDGTGARVSILNSSGDVIAAAVYDFSKHPIQFKNGAATVSLAYDSRQYWQPVDEIDEGGSTVVWQNNQTANGKAAADVDGALGGANIDANDSEKYAQLALANQISYDRSDAMQFYSDYTNQLSSKKYGMEIDGKKWTYADIYQHFLKLHDKHPHAILIWADDYYNYTKHGNASDYYVILSGESFDDEDDAERWCSQNGYGNADCMVVDLS